MFVVVQVKGKKNAYYSFLFLADIQECYEVTLQLNTEQTVVKEDNRRDVWEVNFLLYIIYFKKISLMFTRAVVHFAVTQ